MHGLVIASLIILCSVCETEEIKLQNCNKLDRSKDVQEPIMCEGISKTGSVLWHHEHKAVLGECSANGTCLTYYSDYNITREGSSTVSKLRILTAGIDDNGVEIECTDRESNTKDNCKLILKKVEISSCSSSKLIIFKDAPEAITCQNIPRNGGNIWFHSKDGGTEHELGTCSAGGICSSQNSNQFNIKRDNRSTDSQLVILQNFRNLAGDQITCEDTSQKTRYSCRLVIRRHPVLSNCNISTTCVDRTVNGSCSVNNMFSSDGIYECVWTITDMKNNNTVNQKAGKIEITNQRDLSACSNKDCYRGTCLFEWQLPQEKGNYSFTVTALDSTQTAFSQVISNDGACEVFPPGAHTVSLPPATTPSEESSPSKEKNLVTIIVPVAIITLIILSLTSYLIFRRRRKQNNRRKRQTEKQEEFEEHINDVYQSSYHGTSHSNEST